MLFSCCPWLAWHYFSLLIYPSVLIHLLLNDQLGGFRLYVSRELAEQSAPPQPPAPVTAHAVVETPALNGSPSSPSLALSRPVSSSGGVQSLLDKAADEGLVILQSPRVNIQWFFSMKNDGLYWVFVSLNLYWMQVGYFRRSRTIKGKKAPPSCKEVSLSLCVYACVSLYGVGKLSHVFNYSMVIFTMIMWLLLLQSA